MALITPKHSHQPAPQFSYLGVPATAGTGALLGNLAILVLFIATIESVPRTPIRGRNSEREGQTAIQ